MEQSELLRRVAGALERLGLRYFVTGSMATISFGEHGTAEVWEEILKRSG